MKGRNSIMKDRNCLSIVFLSVLLFLSLPVRAQEKKSGCVFFEKPLSFSIDADTVPAEKEKTGVMKFRIPVGEKEARNFGIHTPEDVTDLSVEVNTIYMGWRDRDQVTVDIKRIDSRQLLPLEPVNLSRGTTQGYTLILGIPEDAPVTAVSGELLVKSGDKVIGKPVKIEIEVLPFRLKEPPQMAWGVFYYGPLRKTRNKFDEKEIAEATVKSTYEALDMRAHGLNTFCIYAGVDHPDETYVKTKTGPDIDLEYLNRYMEVYRAAGFTRPVPYWLSRNAFTEKDAWYPNNWLKFDRKALRKCRRIVEAITTERVKRRWPEVLFYLIDEPGQMGRAELTAEIFEMTHSVPTARTFTCLRPEMMHVFGHHLDVACFYSGADWERIQSLRRIYRFDTWTYQPFKLKRPLSFFRRVGGVTPWRREEGGVLFYRYKSLKIDVEKGISHLIWEAVREGVKDYKYIYTLEVLVEKALQIENDENAGLLAAEAAAFLKSAWDSIEPDEKKGFKNPLVWEKMDEIRAGAEGQILRLLPLMENARFRTFDEELGHRRDETGWEDWLKERGPEKRIKRKAY